MTVDLTPVNPDTGNAESTFRQKVRDILGLDWSTRDLTLYDELRRLKTLDAK